MSDRVSKVLWSGSHSPQVSSPTRLPRSMSQHESPSQLSRPVTEPISLTPQLCFDTTALRDFLRLSRATIDDRISSQLNTLSTPSRYNPYSPDIPDRGIYRPQSSRQYAGLIPSDACTAFKHDVLFPSWEARSRVLSYCREASATPSHLKTPSSSSKLFGPSAPADNASPSHPDVAGSSVPPRNFWGKPQTVDERLDPYSARNYEWTRTSNAQDLDDVLRTEEAVEKIIRARTWETMLRRCSWAREQQGTQTSYEDEWREWKRGKGNGPS